MKFHCHTTRKSSLFIYFHRARLSVRILQYRTRVTDELIFRKRLLCRKKLKNTQKAVFIPTNEGIFPLFRHVNATTARRLHGEVEKFWCLRHAQCHCSIVECFKTKIIDFKSFSTSSSCCCCWCLLFHSLSLMKCDVFFISLCTATVGNRYQVYFLIRYRLWNVINVVACDKLGMHADWVSDNNCRLC